MLAVLIEGGGADAAQFPAGQHRLEQVAGVHRPAGGTGPHHRVDLVDEQDDLPLAGGDLLEHGLEPFLELAAVLGAGDQGAHVEGDQAPVLQGLGHVAVDDALGQTLHDGGLAHARLADQHGVVLGAAAEDLDGAADLLVAADHRIELAVAGGGGQVAAVFLERLVGAFGVLVGHPLAAPHRLHGLLQLRRIGAALGEQLAAAAVIAGQGQEQVLDGDVAVVEVLLQGIGAIQDRIQPLAEVDALRAGGQAGLGGDEGLDLLAQDAEIDTRLLQDPGGQVLLGQQGGEQVLALHLLLALLLGQLLGGHHSSPGLLGEQFGGGMHGVTSGGRDGLVLSLFTV